MKIKNYIMVIGMLVCFHIHAAFESAEDHASYIIQLINQQSNSNQIITVGNEFGCDYQTISEAVNNAQANDEIRVMSISYFEPIYIGSPMRLYGGYQSCQDAINNISDDSKAVVSSSLGTNISINETGTVEIKNIAFKNSTLDSAIEVNALSIDSLISFINVDVSDNHSNEFEAGVMILGGNFYSKDSTFKNNTNGPALACGPGIDENVPSVLLDQGVVFENNINLLGPSAYGGGINSYCNMTLFSGVEINTNHANRGGGMWLSANSVTHLYGNEYCEDGVCIGTTNEAVSFDGNKSAEDGGAIYVDGGKITAVNSLFYQNNSVNRGGAVFLGKNSEFIGWSVNLGDCWGEYCSVYDGNSSASGGAFYINSNAHAEIRNAYMTNQSADAGVISYMDNQSNQVSFFSIEASLLTNNGKSGTGFYEDSGMFHQYAIDPFYSGLLIKKSTIADNHFVDGMIINLSAHLSIRTSIIRDLGTIYFNLFNASTSEFDCLLSHELDSLVGATRSSETTQPGFVNSINGDYHILKGSLAQDYCDDSLQSIAMDIDGDMWNFDDLDQPNIYGAHDVGFDEIRFNLPPQANDDLFSLFEDASETVLPVLENDIDNEGDIVIIESISIQPNFGILELIDGVIKYTPDINYCGVDTFNYILNGGSEAVVNLNVLCVNDQPSFNSLQSIKISLYEINNYQPKQVACEFDFGPDDEDLTQSLSSFEVSIVSDPDNVFDGVIIDNIGQIIPNFTGQAGKVTINLSMIDNGGNSNGGIDQSIIHSLDIQVADFIFTNGFDNDGCQ